MTTGAQLLSAALLLASGCAAKPAAPDAADAADTAATAPAAARVATK